MFPTLLLPPRATEISRSGLCPLRNFVKFSELMDPPDSYAVCFYDFEGEDEIRRLTNCRHVFHRSCVDHWMGYDQTTCPLCRTSFVADDLQETINERLWAAAAASAIPGFFGEYSQINAS
ncbi:hypothetical protein V6N13_145939 [Hibiscus sabdariffa]|uniref:RING-type domain-containing protein n=1 Tax=Hibiscus sabdariffa TaxID=183260 RepID=A0ABR2TRZ5_9ROSI